MATDFTGKIAVVTGAGRGLGAAFSVVLADLGAAVIMAGRNPENLAVAAEFDPAAHRQASRDTRGRSFRSRPRYAYRQENAR